MITGGISAIDKESTVSLLEDDVVFSIILTEFEKLTGTPVLINTSFNVHEEPIVYEPDDAIRTFVESEIDYLATGNFICWQRGN